jgi:ABC-type Fe3+/spermidine/putrescine transport system ATPase subunit
MDAGNRKLRSGLAQHSNSGGGSTTGGAYSVAISRVSKRFGDMLALDDCSLSVEPGEILALLGPSGCGKTTLLNIVAGFETADRGSLRLGGASIDGVPPHLRGVGMVFQNYALFPHLTVAGNISYGLRVLKLGRGETEARVREALRLLKLEGLDDRYPHELSGGQRQRVAVARAMVTRPRALLMDEAFSALDRNLRETMQLEFSLLLRRQGITTILVTHDQKEAFTIADRIAVMEGGRIVQVGSGEDLYHRPASKFVLDFLGASNRFQVVALSTSNLSTYVEVECGIAFRSTLAIPRASTGELAVHVRPGDLRLSQSATEVHRVLPATVELVSFQGAARRIVLRLGSKQVIADLQDKAASPAVGAAVFLDFDPEHALLMGG